MIVIRGWELFVCDSGWILLHGSALVLEADWPNTKLYNRVRRFFRS